MFYRICRRGKEKKNIQMKREKKEKEGEKGTEEMKIVTPTQVLSSEPRKTFHVGFLTEESTAKSKD